MKESFWGAAVVAIGVITIFFILFFQSITNTDEHNYHLLKEATEAAMYDALDLASYKNEGVIRIDREKFVENFLRRFAESATLSNTYKVEIYDVNETPPKVSIKVSSSEQTNLTGEVLEFDISNKIDAILETPDVE
ncbi:MAG TPA: hypothetical protein IAC20_02675 [Candidatus Faecisoma merdavium]|nr:hypothetical protein [Candidatus Faecisoma merdavium]